ncbi:Ycf48-like protein [bacterium HR20]|nr:Ycf48-like protein [bacterium HR20]
MKASHLALGMLVGALVCGHAVAQVWEEVSLPGQFAQGYYLDVFFLPSNPQYGWACGYNGYVVRTTDGGRTWQGSIVPYNGRMGGHLESVQFLDALNGYTSGPAGVFRSTDGGVTWVDATPPFPSEGPWGCYFLSATVGVVLGGGCAGPQNFFRTTNGGQSWTLFQSNQPSSGLTDAILFANGTGYAVSSGLLWQTTDSGATWSVFASSGPAYWNEELTVRGTAFLIPWAGSNCSGQGSGGGGRFTTDGGQSWRSYSTGVPMFGAFLHDAQRGWICGFARQVWYTSDGGQNWQYRGCGTRGDLDDIWMIDDTTGFVVGEGIYRYGRAQWTASRTTLDFGALCPPVLRFDTLYIRNRSWNSALATLRITGSDSAAFAIISPSTQPAAIPSCDSLMVVVRYMPLGEGVHRATLGVEIASGQRLTVSLQGEQLGRAVAVQDTLVQAIGVPAGQTVRLAIPVGNASSQPGQISSVTQVRGANFLIRSTVPLTIPPGGSAIELAFVPPDTGWYEAVYRLRIEPCSYDTLVRVRVYAQSPIISVRAPVWSSACGLAMLDSVRVLNTGNADLQIAALWIEPSDAPFQLVGSSRGGLPIIVPPKDSTWIYVRFGGQGSGVATLVLDHNDGTLVRNVARPLRVALQYTSDRPVWQRSPAVMDFGTLCVGQSRVLFVDVVSRSSVPLTLTASAQPPFSVTTGLPVVVPPTGQGQIGVSFTPDKAGTWEELFVLTVDPCDLRDSVLLRGRAETTALVLEPNAIRVRVQAGQLLRVPVAVRSVGTAQARVVSVKLAPADGRWNVEHQPLPFVLPVGASDTLWITVAADSTSGVLAGTLCLRTDSLCETEQCLSVECTIEPLELYDLRVEPRTVSFAPQRCSPIAERATVTIVNAGTNPEAITAVRIEPPDAPFRIVGLAALPLPLPRGDSSSLVVEYLPSGEGQHIASLVIEAMRSTLRVPLSGNFARVTTTVMPDKQTLGILEPCSPLQQVVFVFHARGLLGDTLRLRQAPLQSSWRLPPEVQQVVVAPNDSVAVAAMFDPSQVVVGLPGVERFVWESIVCPAELRATVEYTVLRPRLAYDPTLLQWDDAMQNSTTAKLVRIWNPSPIERAIVGYDVVTIEGAADVQLQAALPQSIAPGQEYQLRIALTPRQVGPYRALVRLVERSACEDTAVLELRANVEQEFYRARLSIGVHAGLVGDTLRVPVLLTTRDSSADALWRASPEAIGFAVQFNDFVVEPLSAVAGNPPVSVPMEVEPGMLRVRVPRQAVRLLGASDTVAVLSLWGLQSPPLRSELHFTRSWAETDKPYLIEHDDGMVILEACVPWMKVVLSSGVRLAVVPHPIEQGEGAAVMIETDEPMRVRLALVDARGGMQWAETILASRAMAVPLPASLPSGFYILRVENERGQIVGILPLVVVR